MSEEKIDVHMRLNKETIEKLRLITERYKITQNDVMRYLINLSEKHKLLEPNWQDRILAERMEKDIRILDHKYQQQLNLDEHRHDLSEASKEKDRQFNFKLTMMKEYLKTLTEDQKRMVFNASAKEQKLMIPMSVGGQAKALYPTPMPLPSGKYVVYVNAKRVEVDELDERGFPKLAYNNDRLIKCENGFHTKGSWCEFCDLLPICQIVRAERLEKLAFK